MVFLKSLLSSSLGLKSLPWKDHSGNWSSESIRINCQVNRKESALERPERLQGFRGKKAGKAAHSPGSRCTCPLKTDVLSRSTWEGRLKTKLKHSSGLTKAEVCWAYEFPSCHNKLLQTAEMYYITEANWPSITNTIWDLVAQCEELEC